MEAVGRLRAFEIPVQVRPGIARRASFCEADGPLEAGGLGWYPFGAMVNFAIRFDLRCPAFGSASSEDLAQAAIEQCEWADRNGFLSVTLSEHHGSPDGYLPSPLVLGAAIAARTQRLRIVLAALIAPLHDLVRLAEDIAMLDVISNGRVIPVFSGGYVKSEFETFDRKLSDRAKVMESVVPFMRQAFSGESFLHDGRTVRVLPRPVQRPHPPIFMGGASPVAARRAARHGDHFIPSKPEYWDTYREERIRLGRGDPGEVPRTTGNACFVAEDPDRFWEELAPHALHEMEAYGAWAEEAGTDTGYARAESADELRASGDYPIYTPQELIERVREQEPGVTVMLHPLVGGLAPDVSWRMLELFEKEVIPALKGEKS